MVGQDQDQPILDQLEELNCHHLLLLDDLAKVILLILTAQQEIKKQHLSYNLK